MVTIRAINDIIPINRIEGNNNDNDLLGELSHDFVEALPTRIQQIINNLRLQDDIGDAGDYIIFGPSVVNILEEDLAEIPHDNNDGDVLEPLDVNGNLQGIQEPEEIPERRDIILGFEQTTLEYILYYTVTIGLALLITKLCESICN